MEVKIGVSNRHVHLTKEHLEILFGDDYQLDILKELTQPGEYASTDTVIIKTYKNQIDRVRVIGPVRDYSQAEISKTDAYVLGINPPIRDSGDLKGSSKIDIIGPKGMVSLESNCIIPTRHIHITNKLVDKFGIDPTKPVSVRIAGPRGGVMDNVHFKVKDTYEFELHIDTDDANAHIINQGDIGLIEMRNHE